MALIDVDPNPFEVSITTYAPTAIPQCPATPAWVIDATKKGATLKLPLVLTQAGRHFADALNPNVIPGTGTKRAKATELAWYLIAMLNPRVVGTRLVVDHPGDRDIQRIASEVLGAGAGIELLRKLEQIDTRTLKKDSRGGPFDFEANGRGGIGKCSLEFKGTIDDVSKGGHQQSFRKKLYNSGLLGGGRGYNQAIGVIFSAWTTASPAGRGYDFQLLDPLDPPMEGRDEAIREVLRFYARRYDVIVGLERAAGLLWELARQDQPIETIRDLEAWLGRSVAGGEPERRFNRSGLDLLIAGAHRTFWGGFWQASTRPPPVDLSDVERGNLRYAYTGIDSRVVGLMREHRWDDLLNYKGEEAIAKFSFRGRPLPLMPRQAGAGEPAEHGEMVDISGLAVANAEGVVHAWMNYIPDSFDPIMLA